MALIPERGAVVLRGNLIENGTARGIYLDFSAKADGTLACQNNTFRVRGACDFVAWAPALRLRIDRNILTGDAAVLNESVRQHRAAAAKVWEVEHNWLVQSPSQESQPAGPTDIIRPVKFLSEDPADPQFLRVPADGPRPGGAKDDYYGALPPGPAPKEGDWLTRMQLRWKDAPAGKPSGQQKP